jgi:hypothetical protein
MKHRFDRFSPRPEDTRTFEPAGALGEPYSMASFLREALQALQSLRILRLLPSFTRFSQT